MSELAVAGKFWETSGAHCSFFLARGFHSKNGAIRPHWRAIDALRADCSLLKPGNNAPAGFW